MGANRWIAAVSGKNTPNLCVTDWIHRATAAALEAVLPQRCELCLLPSGSSLPLCTHCRAALTVNIHPCAGCALPLPPYAGKPRWCPHCLAAERPFTSITAPFVYDANLAYLVSRWKYQRHAQVVTLLSALWLDAVATTLPEVDLLVTVPLHWSRRMQRGFNQSEMLLLALRSADDALAAIAIDSRRIKKRKRTAAQVGQTAGARHRALAGAFTVTQRCDNLRIAVIEDVVTTGATATATSQALINAGAAEVHIWCLARTPSPESTKA